MNLLLTLIVGGIVGWLASQVVGRSEGVIGSVVIGIVGSLIGGILYYLLAGGSRSYLLFSWVGLFWSLIGSVVFAALLNAIHWTPSNRV